MKKLLGVLFAALLITLLLPTLASAEISGTCGSALKWTMDNAGKLTISGTGEMFEYSATYVDGSYLTTAPWGEYAMKPRVVIIESGVTGIGNYAFCGCNNLTEVSIPDSVTSIGNGAFYGCSSLTEVVIPEGVTSVGNFAFTICPAIRFTSLDSDGAKALSRANFSFRTPGANYDLMYLNKNMNNSVSGLEILKVDKEVTSFNIPEGVTSIGDYAFEECRCLTSLTIPDGVTDIGYSAFRLCGLTEVSIPEGVTSIRDSAFTNCSSLTEVSIPEGVTSIGKRVFSYCVSLTEVSIPEGATFISYGTFSGCSSLTKVSIPVSVITIDEYAFDGCTELKDVIYGGTESARSKRLTIGSNNSYLTSAQWHCVDLGPSIIDGGACGDNLIWMLDDVGTLTISGMGKMWDYYYKDVNGTLITTAPWGAYAANLKKVVIESGVTNIGSYAFDGCSGLTRVSIPEGVTSIGDKAFYWCSSLTEVTIPEGVTSIGEAAFSGCSSLTEVSIPEGVTIIDFMTFYRCSSLTEVRIPYGVTSIGYGAFEDCSNLVELEIPRSVSKISESVFDDCPKLTLVVYFGSTAEGYARKNKIPYRIPQFEILMGSLIKYHGEDSEVVIPTGVISIGNSAFQSCNSLTSVSIPESVISIGDYAFSRCSSLTDVSIQDSVTSIGNSAFSYCGSLTEVSIPDSVTSIGDGVFSSCSSLTDVSIPAGVTSIGEGAFKGCSSLTEMRIPKGVTCIGLCAFSGCSSLTEVSIPKGVTSIGNGAFEHCSSLTEVSIPEGVTSIGNGTFNECSSLTEVSIPDGVTSIGDRAFHDCRSLTEVRIPEGVTSIGDRAFHDCRSLTEVRIPEGVTSIGDWTFYNCSSLTEVSIPEGVTSIGRSAFSGCNSLKGLSSLDGVTSIGDSAFSDCPAICYANMGSDGAKTLSKAGYSFRTPVANYFLIYRFNNNEISGLEILEVDKDATSVRIPEGVTSIGSSAFYGCSSLTELSIPEGVTSIGDEAFRGCSSLTELSIPEGVTSIGVNAFSECSRLTRVSIPDSVTSIGGGAFSSCSHLTRLSIPDGVTSIGGGAFYDCSSLTRLSIPEGVTRIDYSTFSGCSSLTEVSIPEGVTSIDSYAFSDCSSLTEVRIPDSLTSIRGSAFAGCWALRYASIGSNGAKALSKAGLSFRTPGTNYSLIYLFNNDEISDLEITGVDNNATSVSIPEYVTSIDDYVFNFLYQLKTVYFAVQDENRTMDFGSNFFTSNPTVYCYMFTAPDVWCTQCGITPIYLDETDIDTICTVTLPEDFRMPCGDAKRLKCVVFPADSVQITWTSSDPAVVSVDDGMVTALTPGTATITATVGNGSDSVTIETYMAATAITLSESELWLQAKESISLAVSSYLPEGASAELTWSSSDKKIATVDKDGKVKTFKPGDVTITATTEKGIAAGCVLHLTHPVTSVTLVPEIAEVSMNDTLQLTATATTKNDSYTNKLVRFTTSDEGVATVNADGLVTAVHPGIATITVETTNGESATAQITVPCTGHIAVTDPAVAPTCTETGLTEGSHCEVCGAVLTAQEAVPATDHDWNEPYYAWSADNRTVTATIICKNGDHPVTETVQTAFEQTKAPTNTAKGECTYTATFTNALFKAQTRTAEIPALGKDDAVRAVEDAISALSSSAGVADKVTVEAARKAYDALTPEQKMLIPVDVAAKLITAEQQVQAAEQKAAEEAAKQAADQAAVKSAADAISALSSSAGLNDKDAVAAARAAYDALTSEQKALVSADVVAKLTTAEQQVQAAEQKVAEETAKKAEDETAAKAAADAISALSSSAGLNDKDAVAAARAAYDALTPEQKMLIPVDVAAKLITAEQQVQAAEQKAAEEAAKQAADQAAAKSAADAISALSSSAGLNDKDAVAAARAAYDALTSEQKALVSADVVARLTTAEQQVQAAEQKVAEETAKKAEDETAAKSAVDAISALSSSAGLNDKDAVAAARAAYDALTPEQKMLIPVDVAAKLITAEQQVKAAEEAAKTTNISACKITVKDLTYTGKKIKKPTVTVKDGKKKLKEGTDYTISYNTKAKAIGAYKLTVTGKGNYTGSTQLTFNINPKGTAFTKVKGGKQLITLKWKNPKNITGYEIQYSLKKDFSGGKTVKIKKAKTLTTTVKKLEAGSTYYVRIRTYTTVKKKGTFYSTWSKVKTVKTKGSKKNGIDQFIEASMNVGETLDLRTMLGLPNTDMKWESGDEAVATVSDEGVVSALKPGEVVITAIVPDGEQIEVIIRISGADVLELGDVNLLDTEEMITDEMTKNEETTEIELSME